MRLVFSLLSCFIKSEVDILFGFRANFFELALSGLYLVLNQFIYRSNTYISYCIKHLNYNGCIRNVANIC